MLEKIVKNREDVNAAAMHLLQAHDLEELRKLAKTWAVSFQQTEDYIHGKRYRLMEIPITDKAYQSAAEKLREEMIVLNDKMFADIIAWQIIRICSEDPVMEAQVLKKHKSLQRCLDYVTGKAFEMAQAQMKEKGIDNGPQKMGIALTEKEVFPWAEEYYRNMDEKETAEKEEKEKAQIISEWTRRENKEKHASNKTAVSGKGKKSTSKKAQADTKENVADQSANVQCNKKNQKETMQQISLFDL